MFSNLTIAGFICGDRKAAKRPKSSWQAATCWLNLFKLEQTTKKESNLTKLKKSLNLIFFATSWYTYNMRQTLSIRWKSDFLYNLQKVWYENVSRLLSISFHVLTPRYFMDLWRRDVRYLGMVWL